MTTTIARAITMIKEPRSRLKSEMNRCKLSTHVIALQLGESRQTVERYLDGEASDQYFEKKVMEWLE